jgi:hypothetical protein
MQIRDVLRAQARDPQQLEHARGHLFAHARELRRRAVQVELKDRLRERRPDAGNLAQAPLRDGLVEGNGKGHEPVRRAQIRARLVRVLPRKRQALADLDQEFCNRRSWKGRHPLRNAAPPVSLPRRLEEPYEPACRGIRTGASPRSVPRRYRQPTAAGGCPSPPRGRLPRSRSPPSCPRTEATRRSRAYRSRQGCLPQRRSRTVQVPLPLLNTR